ncbi:hypothetical protein [Hymenobacter convexus]|uniref:hypothetical protein n=1 Tax=Hymenobacter sp. CA1UV-4 TaxID=3063782 RepID=UPI00271351E9|nr:hypothetical protein [Hymenobacter sp. CA1UV-4]MDO7850750.1 hypothetical protein [Hymenobacter sp. CA1UV-4]
MKGPNSTYFENPFLTLSMARPAYKAQAAYSLRAGREASLGAAFTPLLAALETAINGFDENLTDGGQSTAGGTDAYHAARTAWLDFVGDTMLDYVTPKLRKLPVFADFKKFGKSKLKALDQGTLLTQSQTLLKLYHAQQAALKYPTLGAEADALYQALAAADETRDTQAATITDARLDLTADRRAIARAQRRLKAQLELAFEEPEKVYSFFDFSAAESARKSAKKAAKATAKVPAAPAEAGPAA